MSSTTSSPPTATSSIEACITHTPGKNGYVPPDACNANYNYNPSFAAAVIFTIMFALTTFAHMYQVLLYKKLKLCWPLLMGAVWELLSFAIRIPGSKNQQVTAYAFVSQILVLLAPMWINAFVYMVLGRMIYFFIPSQQIWSFKGIKITKIFVWLDVLSFVTQVAGGVMISPGSDLVMTGIHVYMGGIGLQQACILLFLSIAVKFHLTMLAQERSNVILDKPRHWRALLYVMYASLALITMRIIFRLVEFAAGMDPSKNPIPFHEAYFLVLDCVPMFVACLLMNVVHPGRVLVGENSEFPKGPSRKEKKVVKAAKKAAKSRDKEDKRHGRQGIRMLSSNDSTV